MTCTVRFWLEYALLKRNKELWEIGLDWGFYVVELILKTANLDRPDDDISNVPVNCDLSCTKPVCSV